MLIVPQIANAQTQQSATSEEASVVKDFLKALQSQLAADLKQPYLLKEFEGGVVFKNGEFFVGGKKIDNSEMAARAEKAGERLLPYLTGAYSPDQFSIFVTAAPLDGIYWTRRTKIVNRQKRVEKNLELTGFEAGIALLALSTKFNDQVPGTDFSLKKIIPSVAGFTSDGFIDADEIGNMGNGSWVELMKKLYKIFYAAKIPFPNLK